MKKEQIIEAYVKGIDCELSLLRQGMCGPEHSIMRGIGDKYSYMAEFDESNQEKWFAKALEYYDKSAGFPEKEDIAPDLIRRMKLLRRIGLAGMAGSIENTKDIAARIKSDLARFEEIHAYPYETYVATNRFEITGLIRVLKEYVNSLVMDENEKYILPEVLPGQIFSPSKEEQERLHCISSMEAYGQSSQKRITKSLPNNKPQNCDSNTVDYGHRANPPERELTKAELNEKCQSLEREVRELKEKCRRLEADLAKTGKFAEPQTSKSYGFGRSSERY